MSITFTKTLLNDIRDRISIASFIGERVKLARAGRNFKGRCPFHNEKTPSFMVSDDKSMFHCFGCGEGGDIFQFVMKFEGMDFPEAVKYLAGIAGVELPRESDPAARAKEDEVSRKKRMAFQINEIVRDYFVSRLFDERAGAAARQYLQQREIHKEISAQLFLGYADNSWDALGFHLSEKKVPTDLAVELGLFKKRDGGGYYDFFRDRLMFPIMSARGEVLGFSGRDLSGKEAAKYVNSPDSVVYHKSNCVYGIDRAAAAIRSADHAILVEGNIDLASLHQAGIANVVAPLGTALTAGQIKLLSRYTRNMTIVFDGDDAGSRSAIRALELFIEAGLSPRFVLLPKNEDPDSLVKKEGAEKFILRIKNAVPLFEYFVDQTVAKTGLDASGKVRASEMIAPMLRAIENPAHRAIYTRLAARRLDIDEAALAGGTVKKRPPDRPIADSMPAIKPAVRQIAANPAERMLVEILLRCPSRAKGVLAQIGHADFEDAWCGGVWEHMEKEVEALGSLNISKMLSDMPDAEMSEDLRKIILGNDTFDDDEALNLANDCIEKIKKRPELLKMKEIGDAIKKAETEGNEEKIFELLREKKELSANLKTRTI